MHRAFFSAFQSVSLPLSLHLVSVCLTPFSPIFLTLSSDCGTIRRRPPLPPPPPDAGPSTRRRRRSRRPTPTLYVHPNPPSSLPHSPCPPAFVTSNPPTTLHSALFKSTASHSRPFPLTAAPRATLWTAFRFGEGNQSGNDCAFDRFGISRSWSHRHRALVERLALRRQNPSLQVHPRKLGWIALSVPSGNIANSLVAAFWLVGQNSQSAVLVCPPTASSDPYLAFCELPESFYPADDVYTAAASFADCVAADPNNLVDIGTGCTGTPVHVTQSSPGVYLGHPHSSYDGSMGRGRMDGQSHGGGPGGWMDDGPNRGPDGPPPGSEGPPPFSTTSAVAITTTTFPSTTLATYSAAPEVTTTQPAQPAQGPASDGGSGSGSTSGTTTTSSSASQMGSVGTIVGSVAGVLIVAAAAIFAVTMIRRRRSRDHMALPNGKAADDAERGFGGGVSLPEKTDSIGSMISLKRLSSAAVAAVAGSGKGVSTNELPLFSTSPPSQRSGFGSWLGQRWTGIPSAEISVASSSDDERSSVVVNGRELPSPVSGSPVHSPRRSRVIRFDVSPSSDGSAESAGSVDYRDIVPATPTNSPTSSVSSATNSSSSASSSADDQRLSATLPPLVELPGSPPLSASTTPSITITSPSSTSPRPLRSPVSPVRNGSAIPPPRRRPMSAALSAAAASAAARRARLSQYHKARLSFVPNSTPGSPNRPPSPPSLLSLPPAEAIASAALPPSGRRSPPAAITTLNPNRPSSPTNSSMSPVPTSPLAHRRGKNGKIVPLPLVPKLKIPLSPGGSGGAGNGLSLSAPLQSQMGVGGAYASYGSASAGVTWSGAGGRRVSSGAGGARMSRLMAGRNVGVMMDAAPRRRLGALGREWRNGTDG
ncbi:hypothetical protein DFJ73DRAFT_909330 [Zopfochytrium polystomum]|nr:hypothetical protein DFJ73DRAFT_909330 [Zopfochytrium polystomum]